MDNDERVQWQRVPGSPSLWTIGPSPTPARDSKSARAFTRFGALVRFGAALRALFARFARLRFSRRARSDSAARWRRSA